MFGFLPLLRLKVINFRFFSYAKKEKSTAWGVLQGHGNLTLCLVIPVNMDSMDDEDNHELI